MKKLLLAATALTFGLALSGYAMADANNTVSGSSDNTNTNQNQTTTTIVPIASDDNNGNNLLSPNHDTTSVDTGNVQPVASGNSLLSGNDTNNQHNGNDANNNQSVNLNTNINANITHTDSHAVSLSGPVTLQVLTATTSRTHPSPGGQPGGIGASGSINVSGATTTSEFSGVQTVGANSGFQGNAQAATAVAATANVTFGANGTN